MENGFVVVADLRKENYLLQRKMYDLKNLIEENRNDVIKQLTISTIPFTKYVKWYIYLFQSETKVRFSNGPTA